MRLFKREKSKTAEDAQLQTCPRCGQLVAEDASHACPECGWDLRDAYQGPRPVAGTNVATDRADDPGTAG
jgi:uncharacterized paraquat-inducible protein A